ncbi:MAG TPA: hypothetical protein VFW16_02675 [Streptosporangiaceae bacterium]|nr:hypothetical protein [Streptosporangiaceae bacterium]
MLELTAHAVRHAPAGLAAYHAAVADLVARVPAEHSDVIASFLRAVAHAAARAAGAMATGS